MKNKVVEYSLKGSNIGFISAMIVESIGFCMMVYSLCQQNSPEICPIIVICALATIPGVMEELAPLNIAAVATGAGVGLAYGLYSLFNSQRKQQLDNAIDNSLQLA